MAVFGIGIGASFTLALILGPMLNAHIGVAGLFWLAAGFGMIGIAMLYLLVPDPQESHVHRDVEAEPIQLKKILSDRQLLRMDAGIFFLHVMMTATFIALPFALRNDVNLPTEDHVWFYLPVLLASVAGMIPLIVVAEKQGKMKLVFTGCVVALIVAEGLLAMTHHFMAGLVAGTFIYFVAFNTLEASLPSLISRMAPAAGKGTAMGVYSTSQFFGAFCGGISGGMMYGTFGVGGVFIVSAGMALAWLMICRGMRFPINLSSQIIFVGKLNQEELKTLEEKLHQAPGVEEIKMVPEEDAAYLKVDKKRYNPDVISELIG